MRLHVVDLCLNIGTRLNLIYYKSRDDPEGNSDDYTHRGVELATSVVPKCSARDRETWVKKPLLQGDSGEYSDPAGVAVDL